jgi:2'-5' RNA ligase
MPSQLCLPGVAAAAPATDRLFFALLPEPAAAQAIQCCARKIQRTHGLQSRLIATHRLHLSLQHLGDHAGIPASWLDVVRRAAAKVDVPAFDLCLDRALTFSGRARESRQWPCVLTASSDSSTSRLHKVLGLAMRDCGIAVPLRAFTPHVTMFYDTSIIAERAVEPIAMKVNEFVIVHSRIGTGKPFELSGRWPLAASA